MHDTDVGLKKHKTGIEGLDHVTQGGLPAGQATLVLGQAAAGKTVLGLQVLAHAVARGEAGVFVTFEESPAQIKRDAASFDWGVTLLSSHRFQLIDARPQRDAQAAGEFDIDGLLSIVAATVNHSNASWIVFDGIDQLLQYQPTTRAAINQVRHINDYCEDEGWTLLLTGKAIDNQLAPAHLEGVEFLLSATLTLSACVINQQLNRSLRIAKFRGSGHITDELPMIIDHQGIQLPYHTPFLHPAAVASTERLSTGINRLDNLLSGGIYRGSSLLISGRPGTAKSTLAASFAQTASERDERTLYISFDELEGPYVRNLLSVGIDLRGLIASDHIRFQSLSAYTSSVTEHFLVIQRLIDAYNPHCLIIDPVSAVLKASAAEGPRMATERLINLVRHQGITTVLTSLNGLQDPEGETTQGQVSTLADSWIVLDYNVRAGERNRSLSIVKSRGAAHSNQQRELLLSSEGLDLADVYEHGTEVLMGTARANKEMEDKKVTLQKQLARQQRRITLERQIDQAEQERQRLVKALEMEHTESTESDRLAQGHRDQVRHRRAPDIENATSLVDDDVTLTPGASS